MVKTFDEWSAAGYRIKKGSKAVGRNNEGVPVFNIDQVWRPGAYIPWRDWGDVDYDDPTQWEDFGNF